MDRPWLLVLPVELLTNICSRFCVHCVGDPDLYPDLDHPARYQHIAEQQRDLASLSRTSRGLHAIATPILYHVLATDKSKARRHMRHQRTLHGRPDLAAYVKRAVFVSYPDLSEFDSAVDHLVPRLGVPPPEGWIAPEMALNLTSNLEHLSLSAFGEAPGSPDLGEYMLSSSSIPALKTLHLSSFPVRFDMDSVSLLLQKAPNLRLLRLDGCGWVSYCAAFQPDLSSLPVLGISRCCFDSRENLPALFAGCGSLQALMYQHDQNPLRFVYTPTPEDLAVALRHCHRTLRYLEIRWGSPMFYDNGLISSLKLFSSLETLIMDAVCVFADLYSGWDGQGRLSPVPRRPLVDFLPTSIRQFLLSRVDHRMYQNLADLAQSAREGAFPNLKEMWIDQSSSYDALWETDVRTLEADFALAGISLKCSSYWDGVFSDPEALVNQNYRLHIVGRLPLSAFYSSVALPGA